jgi:hypothetical protein
MTIGLGNLVALICIVISIIFAIVTNQATNAPLVGALSYLCRLMVGSESTLGVRVKRPIFREPTSALSWVQGADSARP